jgi:hypothetical protein
MFFRHCPSQDLNARVRIPAQMFFYSYLIAIACCLAAPVAMADSVTPTAEPEAARGSSASPSVWLLSGFLSRHLANQDQYDQRNTGLGLAYEQNENWALAGGVFHNSLGDRSRYIQAQWTPSAIQGRWGDLRIKPGISAGVVDGYKVVRDGKVFLSALPFVKFEYGRLGMQVIYVPTIGGKVDGAVALQLSLRIFQ